MPATGGSKQERKRYMRNGLWSIVVGGVVGALLWVGPVVAQPFPDGLRAWVRQLKTCQANLDTCQTDLEACQAEPKHFFGDELDEPRLLAPRYRDNGNGTFTDTETGLMWEKKDFNAPLGSIHHPLTEYTWSNVSAVFLATLNTRPCFATFCDWRIPTVKELLSLVDYSKINPATTIPGDVSPIPYWSSTFLAGFPGLDPWVWYVSLSEGQVNYIPTNVLGATSVARAVRGRSSQ